MNSRDFLFPVIILPIGIVFVFVCFMVYLSKGKYRKLILAKLTLGAFILSFSWMSSFAQSNVKTCYVPIKKDFSPRLIGVGMSYKTGDTLKISFPKPTYNYYTFLITNNKNGKAIEKPIIIEKSQLNNPYPVLVINKKYKKGFYTIKVLGMQTKDLKKRVFVNNLKFEVE